MTGPAHWTRPLKSGGVEFYFRAPDGQTMAGAVLGTADLESLRRTFEAQTGCNLPEPVERPMRGKR